MSQDFSRMLNSKDSVFLLIDHQAGLMLFPDDIEPSKLRSNSIALAKTAKLHKRASGSLTMKSNGKP
ncbi:hypothetical protein BC008_24735 [Mastigocoleus testarum BC008]|uniref:Isochorismatase-like domain-containing protein n=1 Tax=Mastigocoleus testarum BC008 TaxID=371196 RepID=A0A0V7ZPK9_9CYAN|nr:hypothetical protein BC008_24735 [Mastigocoleus testarum BC008]